MTNIPGEEEWRRAQSQGAAAGVERPGTEASPVADAHASALEFLRVRFEQEVSRYERDVKEAAQRGDGSLAAMRLANAFSSNICELLDRQALPFRDAMLDRLAALASQHAGNEAFASAVEGLLAGRSAARD